MSRVLVSGAAGFLGRYLTDHLAHAYEVIAVDVVCPDDLPAIRLLDADDPEALGAVVLETRPDAIVHAGFVNRRPSSWSESEYLCRQQAVDSALFPVAADIGARMLLIGSSAVYGDAGHVEHIDEDCPRRPVSLYGVAKASQEMLAEYHAEANGLELVILRLFNLMGPGQPSGMVIPDWVTQASRIAKGETSTLRVYNTCTARDFVDVRDVVRAVSLVLADFRNGAVLNVAGGESVSLSEVVAELRGLCPVSFEVTETAPAKSPTDPLRQQGDSRRLFEGWNWRPEISWRSSLRDVWHELLEA